MLSFSVKACVDEMESKKDDMDHGPDMPDYVAPEDYAPADMYPVMDDNMYGAPMGGAYHPEDMYNAPPAMPPMEPYYPPTDMYHV